MHKAIEYRVENVYNVMDEYVAKRKELKMKTFIKVIALMLCAVMMTFVFVSCGNKAETVEGEVYADIVIKDYGTVTVKLDADAAPITVANFVKLAKDGFYDGLLMQLRRAVQDGFMKEAHLALLHVTPEPEALLDSLFS